MGLGDERAAEGLGTRAGGDTRGPHFLLVTGNMVNTAARCLGLFAFPPAPPCLQTAGT